jgi:hypothetical protein
VHVARHLSENALSLSFAVDAGFASAQIALGFDIRSEFSELPLKVVTVDPRGTAVQIVEPDLHRGEVTFAGGQSHDHFVELALDAVEPCVNAAQVNKHEFFGFVRLLWGMFVVSHGRGPPLDRSRGVAWCFNTGLVPLIAQTRQNVRRRDSLAAEKQIAQGSAQQIGDPPLDQVVRAVVDQMAALAQAFEVAQSVVSRAGLELSQSS